MARILYLSSGGSIHDRRFLVKLAERGYTTCYAYLNPAGKRDVDGLRGDVTTCHLGYDPARSKVGKATDLLKAYRTLVRLLGTFRPDVLHAGWVQRPGLMAAISGYRPFLLMPWGSDVLVSPKRGTLVRALTRYVIRQADMITCDAESVKREIIRLASYPPEKIVVFPWGVDLGMFRPAADLRQTTRARLGWKDNKVIIMTRNFWPVYGVEYFLQALPHVFSQIPDARALLVGSGPLESMLRSLADRLGVSDKIRFLGAVPNDHLPRYLNAADLYVSSSLSDGTSLSLLEALACALPVVVTDVGANLEWIDHAVNGLVVPRKDVDALAHSIVSLLLDEELCTAMRTRNLTKARERADWNKNFGILEQLYKHLAEHHGARTKAVKGSP